MIDYPNKLSIIFDKLINHSIKPIIIGGYIRDFLLQKESKQENRSEGCFFSKDIDIELYGISSFSKLEEILEEFGDVNSVGKSFGVCKLRVGDLDLDFSFPRIDSKIDNGHKGFEIKVDSSLDFKTATSRRDFTINAIGYDVETQEILDPFNGKEDLKNNILRAVDIKKFGDDPLRVLRAVQFSSRFNLKLDNELFKICEKMIKESLLAELPQERIFTEIKKLLLKSSFPSSGIELLKKLGAFKFFTQLASLNDDEYNKTLIAIDKMSSFKTTNKTSNLALMLAALCHKLSVNKCETFLTGLTLDKRLSDKTLAFVNHQNYIDINTFTDYDIYMLATKVNIEEFVLFYKAIHNSQAKLQKIDMMKNRAEELNILNTQVKALLHGKDIISLGIKPSKEFTTILKKAYTAQISGIFQTKEEAYLWLKKELFA